MLTVAAEGHVYAGDIENGAWVDAQHLEVGDELLGPDSKWQEVVGTEIKIAKLQAYNLTVDGYSTYFFSGAELAAGVWVHNRCFDANDFPNDFRPIDIEQKTEFGQDQFKGPNDEILYKGHDGRFYTKVDHPPTSIHAFQSAGVNRAELNDPQHPDAQQTNLDRTGSGDSGHLDRNMRLIGFQQPIDTAAHHIVPHGAYSTRTEPAIGEIQQQLDRGGVGVNEAANGVYLPRNGSVARPPAETHAPLHTDAYFRDVRDRLEGLTDPGDIRAELQEIARDLGEGAFW